MLWVSLPKRLRNYRILPKFIGIWQNVPLAALRKFWMHAAYNITTTTRRCNHIFTLDFAEMNIKALLYTQTDCTKIVTTTSTIQLNNWHYINLFSNGNLWSRHETSSKLWHRPIQSRTTRTQSLTVTLFNCANVVASASVGSIGYDVNVQTFVVLPTLSVWAGVAQNWATIFAQLNRVTVNELLLVG